MYKHIFFDLDHTLWDFNRNSQESLLEILESFRLLQDFPNLDTEAFVQTFYVITEELWEAYNQTMIDSKTLRSRRFPLIFERLHIPATRELCDRIAQQYAHICPRKGHLLPYATEVLTYLKQDYPLHIITNGFPDIQSLKLAAGKIDTFFELVVTSASANCKKPDPRIFQFALNELGIQAQECLMIGDNYKTDIQGAQSVGIDHIYINPEKKAHTYEVQTEIYSLKELMALL